MSDPIEITPDRVRRALDETLGGGSYQVELPARSPLEEGWSDDLFGWLLDVLRELASLSGLGWLAVVVLVGISVVLLARMALAGWAAGRRGPGPTNERRDSLGTVTTRPLVDARVLAEAGDFGGAIHVLLLRTIEELRDTSAYEPAPALTSREILARAPLSPEATRILGDLIHRVEIFYFGSHSATQRDFLEAGRQFEAFRRACR